MSLFLTEKITTSSRHIVHRLLFTAAFCVLGSCSASAQKTQQPQTAKSSTQTVAAPTKNAKLKAFGPVSPDPALSRMGINLSDTADWNTELPFVDVFRMSREWVSQNEGAGWGQGPKLSLDANGYVKSLEAGITAETLVNTVSRYPAGRYTVFYKGKGRLDVGGSAKKVSDADGKMIIDANGNGSIFLRLLELIPKIIYATSVL